MMEFSLPLLDIDAGAVGVIDGPGTLGEQPFEIVCRGEYVAPIHWRVIRVLSFVKIDFRFGDGLEGTTRYVPQPPDAGKVIAQWGRPELIVELLYVPCPEGCDMPRGAGVSVRDRGSEHVHEVRP